MRGTPAPVGRTYLFFFFFLKKKKHSRTYVGELMDAWIGIWADGNMILRVVDA